MQLVSSDVIDPDSHILISNVGDQAANVQTDEIEQSSLQVDTNDAALAGSAACRHEQDPKAEGQTGTSEGMPAPFPEVLVELHEAAAPSEPPSTQSGTQSGTRSAARSAVLSIEVIWATPKPCRLCPSPG